MIIEVKKYGNSLVVPLNSALANLFNITAGTKLEVLPDKKFQLKVANSDREKLASAWKDVNEEYGPVFKNLADK